MEIAEEAGFFLVLRPGTRIVAQRYVLECGVRADVHLIVTLACRRKLTTDGKAPSEGAVQRMVKRRGFQYRPRDTAQLAALLANHGRPPLAKARGLDARAAAKKAHMV